MIGDLRVEGDLSRLRATGELAGDVYAAGALLKAGIAGDLRLRHARFAVQRLRISPGFVDQSWLILEGILPR